MKYVILDILYWSSYGVVVLCTVINAGLAMIGVNQAMNDDLVPLQETAENIINFNVHIIPVMVIALVIMAVMR